LPRRLVSASFLPHSAWTLAYARRAGASCSFCLQASQGPRGQALLPAPGISPGDLVRFPGSPCRPGSRRSPLPQGALPFGGEIPTPLFATYLSTSITPGCQVSYSVSRPSCSSCQPWQPERSIFLTESPIIAPASSTPPGSSRGQCLTHRLDKPRPQNTIPEHSHQREDRPRRCNPASRALLLTVLTTAYWCGSETSAEPTVVLSALVPISQVFHLPA
jgi:hypothetical protein